MFGLIKSIFTLAMMFVCKIIRPNYKYELHGIICKIVNVNYTIFDSKICNLLNFQIISYEVIF